LAKGPFFSDFFSFFGENILKNHNIGPRSLWSNPRSRANKAEQRFSAFEIEKAKIFRFPLGFRIGFAVAYFDGERR
jgi:hypothetical protein